MKYLDLPYKCGASSICTDGERAAIVLGRLSHSFGLDGLSSEPHHRVYVTLADSFEGTPLFSEQDCLDFHFKETGEAVVTIRQNVDLDDLFFYGVCGRLLLIGINALYPAKRVALHGALLEENGEGVVLLADSGVGKSTTLKRHRKNGGTGIADDWLLINDTTDGFIAQVLPTWSKVSHYLDSRFPLAHCVPLKGIGVLARADGTPPRKESIDELDFFVQAFNASEALTGLVMRKLPKRFAIPARRSHLNMIDRILQSYTPFKYYASLDDNPSDILFH